MHPQSTAQQLPLFVADKVCSRCHIARPLSAFSEQRGGRYGRDSRCKTCRAAVRRRRYYEHRDQERAAALARYHSDRQRWQERHRAWLAAHKAEVQDYKRRYRAQHADEIRAAYKRWAEEHRAALKTRNAAYRLTYYSTHRERYCHNARVRQARQKANGGSLRIADIRILYAGQAGRCAYCGELLPAIFHIEHRIPIIRGGTSDPDNICLACPPCNLRKGTKTEDEYRALMSANDVGYGVAFKYAEREWTA